MQQQSSIICSYVHCKTYHIFTPLLLFPPFAPTSQTIPDQLRLFFLPHPRRPHHQQHSSYFVRVAKLIELGLNWLSLMNPCWWCRRRPRGSSSRSCEEARGRGRTYRQTDRHQLTHHVRILRSSNGVQIGLPGPGQPTTAMRLALRGRLRTV